MEAEPKLLTSAIVQMKERLEDAQSEVESSNYLGMQSMLNSRETTPSNPMKHSVRRKNPQNHRNKSMASELYDIESNPEEEQAVPKHKHPDFRLYDTRLGQSEAVYKHVFGVERVVDPVTVMNWKDCLSHEDKAEIYLPVGQ